MTTGSEGIQSGHTETIGDLMDRSPLSSVKRVNLDINTRLLYILEGLKSLQEAASYAEVVRNALGILVLIKNLENVGEELFLIRASGERVKIYPRVGNIDQTEGRHRLNMDFKVKTQRIIESLCGHFGLNTSELIREAIRILDQIVSDRRETVYRSHISTGQGNREVEFPLIQCR